MTLPRPREQDLNTSHTVQPLEPGCTGVLLGARGLLLGRLGPGLVVACSALGTWPKARSSTLPKLLVTLSCAICDGLIFLYSRDTPRALPL